jgi:hypothetical protein
VKWNGLEGGLYVVVVGITRYHVLNPKSAFVVLANFDIWIQIMYCCLVLEAMSSLVTAYSSLGSS